MRVVCSISREVDAKQIGFDQIDRTRVEITVLELSRNILAHAGSGELLLELVEQTTQPGMLVEASDHGPGIIDISLAMRDGYSTANTLGAGLPGVQRLMDTFEIESTVGVGTRVRAIKWLTPPARRSTGGSQ
jgi:serine/threonine-protein kinase RsbT